MEMIITTTHNAKIFWHLRLYSSVEFKTQKNSVQQGQNCTDGLVSYK